MRTETEIRDMLQALREEIVRWDAEIENAGPHIDDEDGYVLYCERILAELHDKCGQLEWVLNAKNDKH